MTTDAWKTLEGAPAETLRELFAAEPDRLARLAVEEAGIRFDFAKTHLSSGAGRGLPGPRRSRPASPRAATRCSPGEHVNPTEGRAAEHSAERGQGAPDSVARRGAASMPECAR